MLDGGLGAREQQALLAAHALEVAHELLLDPVLGVRADLVHALDQQIDERVGDLRCARPAQHREQRKPDRLGHARRSDGYAADGRARHAAISFSEQSENRPAGRPSERTRSSLSISSSTVFRLGRPDRS
jgi:hypothetical protein